MQGDSLVVGFSLRMKRSCMFSAVEEVVLSFEGEDYATTGILHLSLLEMLPSTCLEIPGGHQYYKSWSNFPNKD